MIGSSEFDTNFLNGTYSNINGFYATIRHQVCATNVQWLSPRQPDNADSRWCIATAVASLCTDNIAHWTLFAGSLEIWLRCVKNLRPQQVSQSRLYYLGISALCALAYTLFEVCTMISVDAHQKNSSSRVAIPGDISLGCRVHMYSDDRDWQMMFVTFPQLFNFTVSLGLVCHSLWACLLTTLRVEGVRSMKQTLRVLWKAYGMLVLFLLLQLTLFPISVFYNQIYEGFARRDIYISSREAWSDCLFAHFPHAASIETLHAICGERPASRPSPLALILSRTIQVYASALVLTYITCRHHEVRFFWYQNVLQKLGNVMFWFYALSLQGTVSCMGILLANHSSPDDNSKDSRRSKISKGKELSLTFSSSTYSSSVSSSSKWSLRKISLAPNGTTAKSTSVIPFETPSPVDPTECDRIDACFGALSDISDDALAQDVRIKPSQPLYLASTSNKVRIRRFPLKTRVHLVSSLLLATSNCGSRHNKATAIDEEVEDLEGGRFKDAASSVQHVSAGSNLSTDSSKTHENADMNDRIDDTINIGGSTNNKVRWKNLGLLVQLTLGWPVSEDDVSNHVLQEVHGEVSVDHNCRCSRYTPGDLERRQGMSMEGRSSQGQETLFVADRDMKMGTDGDMDMAVSSSIDVEEGFRASGCSSQRSIRTHFHISHDPQEPLSPHAQPSTQKHADLQESADIHAGTQSDLYLHAVVHKDAQVSRNGVSWWHRSWILPVVAWLHSKPVSPSVSEQIDIYASDNVVGTTNNSKAPFSTDTAMNSALCTQTKRSTIAKTQSRVRLNAGSRSIANIEHANISNIDSNGNESLLLHRLLHLRTRFSQEHQQRLRRLRRRRRILDPEIHRYPHLLLPTSSSVYNSCSTNDSSNNSSSNSCSTSAKIDEESEGRDAKQRGGRLRCGAEQLIVVKTTAQLLRSHSGIRLSRLVINNHNHSYDGANLSNFIDTSGDSKRQSDTMSHNDNARTQFWSYSPHAFPSSPHQQLPPTQSAPQTSPSVSTTKVSRSSFFFPTIQLTSYLHNAPSDTCARTMMITHDHDYASNGALETDYNTHRNPDTISKPSSNAQFVAGGGSHDPVRNAINHVETNHHGQVGDEETVRKEMHTPQTPPHYQ